MAASALKVAALSFIVFHALINIASLYVWYDVCDVEGGNATNASSEAVSNSSYYETGTPFGGEGGWECMHRVLLWYPLSIPAHLTSVLATVLLAVGLCVDKAAVYWASGAVFGLAVLVEAALAGTTIFHTATGSWSAPWPWAAVLGWEVVVVAALGASLGLSVALAKAAKEAGAAGHNSYATAAFPNQPLPAIGHRGS